MNEEKIKRKVIKYKSNEKFIIARRSRQTINYIIKNTENFPNKYIILKNNIINTSYSMLENNYRANIFQDINDKNKILFKLLGIYRITKYIEDNKFNV